MDTLILVLSVVGVVCSLGMATLVYQVTRVFLDFVRDDELFGDSLPRRFILRCDSRIVGLLCAMTFLALVL